MPESSSQAIRFVSTLFHEEWEFLDRQYGEFICPSLPAESGNDFEQTNHTWKLQVFGRDPDFNRR